MERSPTEETIEGWKLNAWGGQFTPSGEGPRGEWLECDDDGVIGTTPVREGLTAFVPMAVMKRFLTMAYEWRSQQRREKGEGRE